MLKGTTCLKCNNKEICESNHVIMDFPRCFKQRNDNNDYLQEKMDEQNTK